MNAKDCRAMRREIDQSELGQRLSQPLLAHIAVCDSCAQFQKERARLRELVGSLEPVTAPADFEMRLRARIAREKDAARQPYIFRFVLSTPGIALAALLVILVGGIVWINQRNANQTSNSASATNQNKETPSATGASSSTLNNENTSVAAKPGSDVLVDNPKPTNSSPRKPVLVANAPSQTSDFSVTQAQSIRLTPDRDGEVSLTAPVNPMVVSVRDEHGGTRRILLPPVSFGSQRLTDNRVPVSMNNTRDW